MTKEVIEENLESESPIEHHSVNHLSDETRIGHTQWSIMKEYAMKEDYAGQLWFGEMSADD